MYIKISVKLLLIYLVTGITAAENKDLKQSVSKTDKSKGSDQSKDLVAPLTPEQEARIKEDLQPPMKTTGIALINIKNKVKGPSSNTGKPTIAIAAVLKDKLRKVTGLVSGLGFGKTQSTAESQTQEDAEEKTNEDQDRRGKKRKRMSFKKTKQKKKENN